LMINNYNKFISKKQIKKGNQIKKKITLD